MNSLPDIFPFLVGLGVGMLVTLAIKRAHNHRKILRQIMEQLAQLTALTQQTHDLIEKVATDEATILTKMKELQDQIDNGDAVDLTEVIGMQQANVDRLSGLDEQVEDPDTGDGG